MVYKGKEAKANVRIAIYGDYTFNDTENVNMDALEKVLSTRLLERLREEESGIYGTRASIGYSKYPKGRYSLSVSFGTSVDKYKSLIASTLDEFKKSKKANGPSQTDLDKFVIEEKRQLELSLKENGFWMSQLVSASQNGEDLAGVTKYLEDLSKVTVKSVKDVCEQIHQRRSFVQIHLVARSCREKIKTIKYSINRKWRVFIAGSNFRTGFFILSFSQKFC